MNSIQKLTQLSWEYMDNVHRAGVLKLPTLNPLGDHGGTAGGGGGYAVQITPENKQIRVCWCCCVNISIRKFNQELSYPQSITIHSLIIIPLILGVVNGQSVAATISFSQSCDRCPTLNPFYSLFAVSIPSVIRCSPPPPPVFIQSPGPVQHIIIRILNHHQCLDPGGVCFTPC